MSEPITVSYDKLKDWQGGDSNGYSEPDTNTIHVIRGEDLELKMVLHEKIHLQRKNKTTFKLGSLIVTPFSNILLLILVGISFVTAPTGYIMLSFYICLIICLFYEEKTTWKLTMKKLREINQ
jgi:hypothetical protein